MDLSLKEAKDIIEVALKTQASKKFKPMAVAVLSKPAAPENCPRQGVRRYFPGTRIKSPVRTRQTGTIFYSVNEFTL